MLNFAVGSLVVVLLTNFLLEPNLKLGFNRQYLSGGSLGPVNGLMSGRGVEFLCRAMSINN